MKKLIGATTVSLMLLATTAGGVAQAHHLGDDLSVSIVRHSNPGADGNSAEAGSQDGPAAGAAASSSADCQGDDVAVRILTGILGHVNTAGRANIVIARNVGGHGSVQSASATQTSTVRQTDGQTQEESETTTLTCSETGG